MGHKTDAAVTVAALAALVVGIANIRRSQSGREEVGFVATRASKSDVINAQVAANEALVAEGNLKAAEDAAKQRRSATRSMRALTIGVVMLVGGFFFQSIRNTVPAEYSQLCGIVSLTSLAIVVLGIVPATLFQSFYPMAKRSIVERDSRQAHVS